MIGDQMFDTDEKNLLEKVAPFLNIGTLLILLVVLYFVVSRSKSFPRSSAYLSEDSLKESVCLQGFQSIADKKASDALVSKEIITILEDQNYTNFQVEVKDVFKPVLVEDKCKIVTRDKLGLRGFMLDLKKDVSYPANYYVDDIEEVKLGNEGV